jgi:hypothetical protein
LRRVDARATHQRAHLTLLRARIRLAKDADLLARGNRRRVAFAETSVDFDITFIIES